MKRFGFTIAEILITLCIIGFIGALGIPMLGPQKAKKPDNIHTNHGLFECYYDGSTLKQRIIDNNNHTTAEVANAEGGACTFTPPVANFFVITLVSAGQDGNTTTLPGYTVSAAAGASVGTVSISTDFQSSLNSAPDWVKNDWNAQWAAGANPAVIPTYFIDTGMAISGSSKCLIGNRENDTNCYGCSVANGITGGCPSECFIEGGNVGGNSGNGKRITFSHKLLSSDHVNFTTGDTLTVDFNNTTSVSVTRPGNGTNGTEEAPGVNGKDSEITRKNITLNNDTDLGRRIAFGSDSDPQYYCSYSSASNKWYDLKKNCGQNPADYLFIDAYCRTTPRYADLLVSSVGLVSDEVIEYRSVEPIVNATYSPSGNPGRILTRIYEHLPEGQLSITPARTGQDGTITAGGQVLARVTNEAAVSEMIDVEYVGETGIAENPPFPNKDECNRKILDQSVGSFLSLVGNYTGVVNTHIRNGLIGASGFGAYPKFTSTNLQYNQVKSINNVPIGQAQRTVPISNSNCLNGQASGTNGSNQDICRASAGTPGAVVIAW